MSWKKNVFSYLLWVLYAVAAEAGLVCLADGVCDLLGVDIRRGTIVCGLYIGAAGLAVALIHRFGPKHFGTEGKRSPVGTAARIAVVATLLAVGLVLRAQEMQATGAVLLGESSEYYRQAVMASQGELPQFAHGAVYAYVNILHGLFFFLGNKPAAAVWLQLLLQMGGMLLLYLALRRLSGNMAALVAFAIGVLSPFFIREALFLSPAVLYFFFWAAGLLLISAAVGTKKSPPVFFIAGAVIACVSYLDAVGLSLLWIAAAAALCEEESKPGWGRKLSCLLPCLGGAGAGFIVCGMADCQLSGRGPGEVIEAWILRYKPAELRLPLSTAPSEALTEYIVLFCILTLGIFSFWRNRRSDYRMAWTLLLGILAAGGCYGIFTEEIPMGIYMYLLLAVMAGIAVEECIRPVPVVRDGVAAALCGAEGEVPAGAVEEKREVPAGAVEEKREVPAGTVEEKKEVPAGAVEEKKEVPAGTVEEKREVPAEVPETRRTEGEAPAAEKHKPVQMIENPLPLPKKHVRKKMDYGVVVSEGKDDFDYEVDEGDDFDI